MMNATNNNNTNNNTNTTTTTGTHAGWFYHLRPVGNSPAVEPVYRVPSPNGGTELVIPYGTPGLGVQWGLYYLVETSKLIRPRSDHWSLVWRPVGTGGWKLLRPYFVPRRIAFTWRHAKDAAYESTAVALAGRAHMPRWQRDREEPVPSWREAAEAAAAAAPDRWELAEEWEPLPGQDPTPEERLEADRCAWAANRHEVGEGAREVFASTPRELLRTMRKLPGEWDLTDQEPADRPDRWKWPIGQKWLSVTGGVATPPAEPARTE